MKHILTALLALVATATFAVTFALLTLGSWTWLSVNGVTITAYGDSRYIRQTSITNVVKNVVNSLDIKGGGISQEELLPFGSNIAHSVMMSVVTNNLPNLTWDSKLNLAWKKSAEGGCFYETAYSNVNVIVTGELRR